MNYLNCWQMSASFVRRSFVRTPALWRWRGRPKKNNKKKKKKMSSDTRSVPDLSKYKYYAVHVLWWSQSQESINVQWSRRFQWRSKKKTVPQSKYSGLQTNMPTPGTIVISRVETGKYVAQNGKKIHFDSPLGSVWGALLAKTVGAKKTLVWTYSGV